MKDFSDDVTGRFCWIDLAATDVAAAKRFYGGVFGWTFSETHANGGSFTRVHAHGQDVGSLYQLSRSHLEGGVPSHWTPYVRVDHVAQAAQRVSEYGGAIIVPPFVVQDFARIALVQDAVGALVGILEPLQAANEGLSHG
jgi:predicted enzyme related to lactoylglutathione lyase